MKKEVLLRKEADLLKEIELERKTNAWKARKDEQNQKKKELETKWFM